MQTGSFKTTRSIVIQVLHNAAAKGIKLQICCDNDQNCPAATNSAVTAAAEAGWTRFSALCSKRTTKVRIPVGCLSRGLNGY